MDRRRHTNRQGWLMRTARFRHKCLMSLVLCIGVSASCMHNSAPGTPLQAAAQSDETQILEVIQRMQDAWNRGDFRGYMQGFKNPGVIFVSGGRFQDGWQGTLDHYLRDYGESRGTLRFYDIQIEMLAPDAAQLISRFELVKPQHPQYGINTRLMRKVDQHWVIALNHVSASETPPTGQGATAQ